MPLPYTLDDIEKVAQQGLITKQERALLRQDFYQQANNDEAVVRKLVSKLSHEVTEGWKNIKQGDQKGKSLEGAIQSVAGALQILSALPVAAGQIAGESVQNYLVSRGANPTVAALAATVADMGVNTLASYGMGKAAKAAGTALTPAAKAAPAAAAATQAAPKSEQVTAGIAQWIEEKQNPKNLIDIVKQPTGDLPLGATGKAGVMEAERLALPKPVDMTKAGKLIDDALQSGEALDVHALQQAVQAPNIKDAIVKGLHASEQANGAAKQLDKVAPAIPKVLKLTPGDAQAMKTAMETETDPYTLFSMAMEQSTPRDIRQVAANRLGDLNQKDVFNFLRNESDPAFLERIGQSGMFDSVTKQTAKDIGKTMARGGLDTSSNFNAMARARMAYAEGEKKYEAARITLKGLQEQATGDMPINKVLNLQPGEAKTPLEIVEISKPVRALGESLIQNVDEAEAQVAKGDYSKFHEMMADFNLLVEAHWPYMFPREVAGQTTGVYREPTLSVTRYLEQIPKYSSWLGKLKIDDVDQMEAAAPMIIKELQKIKSPEEIANYSKTIAKQMAEHGDEVLNTPTIWDKMRYFFINSLMSSSDTIGRNVSGNVSGAMFHYPEKLTSATAAKVLNPWLSPEHHLEGGYMNEANIFAATWSRSMWDATRYALTRQWGKLHEMVPDAEALKELTGNRYDLKKFTTGSTNPFSGWAGTLVGTPVNIAQAADEVSRIANYRAAISERIYRDWVTGGKQIPWKQYFDDALQNVPPSAHEYGVRMANEFTFSDRMSAFGRSISNLRENVPGAYTLAPFVRTPDRITAFEYNRTPGLSLLSTRLRDEMMSGDPTVKAEALGRVIWANTVGTGLFFAARTVAPDGMNLITGGGPTDRALARKMQDEKVHLPYTIWTPWGRISYGWLHPIRGPLGIISDTAEVWDEIKNPGEASSIWGGIALGLTRNFFDTTYTKQLSDIVQLWDNPARSSSAFARLGANVVKGFMEPAIFRQIMRTFDPTVKEPYDLWTELTRDIPGWGGPARKNPLTGEPVMNPPRLLSDIPLAGWVLPSAPVQAADDEFAKTMQRLKIKPPDAPNAIAGQLASESPFAYSGPLGEAREAKSGIPIPPQYFEERDRYIYGSEDSGTTLNEDMQNLVKDPDFKKMADIDQADAILSTYHSRYSTAVERLKVAHPELVDQYEQKMEQRDLIHLPPDERAAYDRTERAPAETVYNPGETDFLGESAPAE